MAADESNELWRHSIVDEVCILILMPLLPSSLSFVVLLKEIGRKTTLMQCDQMPKINL